MRRHPNRLFSTAALLSTTGLLLVASACAPQQEAPAASASPASCTRDQLGTVKPGTFTVATDKPAYGPWFSDDDPANGKGYESAVAYAVADRARLRPVRGDVDRRALHQRVRARGQGLRRRRQPGVDHRRPPQAVDFSSPYYDVTQTVVTTKGSPIDGGDARWPRSRAPSSAPRSAPRRTRRSPTRSSRPRPRRAYDTNDLAVQALKNGQIDGIVVDLPTAFYMVAAQLDDGVIVGQLPQGSGAADQFGLVLAKGSALTPCVSQAVDALRADGTLAGLEKTWLAGTDGAPQLS